MTRALLAAKSGWGKSWVSQQWTEQEVEKYEYAVVLDYKDEYRGLAKSGLFQWAAVGDTERRLSAAQWRELIEANPHLIAVRAVGVEEWREAAATIIKAARGLTGTVLVVVDESHFVAPQSGGYPDEIKGLATTGRGEGASSAWVSQRLQELDETVISQVDTRLLGGFGSDRDLTKIRPVTSYNADVHDVNATDPGGQWDTTLQKWDAERGIAGSEWIYSTDSGALDRLDSREMSMDAEHYGGDDVEMSPPGR